MSSKKWLALALIFLLITSVLTGCATRSAGGKDEATNFMAWQFAQAVVKHRMEQPNKSTFPRYSYATIEKDGNTFTIKANVYTLDANSDNTVSYDFTVVARYVGSDVFEEVSVELVKDK